MKHCNIRYLEITSTGEIEINENNNVFAQQYKYIYTVEENDGSLLRFYLKSASDVRDYILS